MSQTPPEKSGQPATARAEAILDNMGRRLGLFAARAGQRIQNAASSLREEANQPTTAPAEKASQSTSERAEEKGAQTMERSEELVDQAVQRLSHFALLAGFQMQKATARLREEAEDIWAEAQNIRQENSRKLQ